MSLLQIGIVRTPLSLSTDVATCQRSNCTAQRYLLREVLCRVFITLTCATMLVSHVTINFTPFHGSFGLYLLVLDIYVKLNHHMRFESLHGESGKYVLGLR